MRFKDKRQHNKAPSLKEIEVMTKKDQWGNMTVCVYYGCRVVSENHVPEARVAKTIDKLRKQLKNSLRRL